MSWLIDWLIDWLKSWRMTKWWDFISFIFVFILCMFWTFYIGKINNLAFPYWPHFYWSEQDWTNFLSCLSQFHIINMPGLPIKCLWSIGHICHRQASQRVILQHSIRYVSYFSYALSESTITLNMLSPHWDKDPVCCRGWPRPRGCVNNWDMSDAMVDSKCIILMGNPDILMWDLQ